MFWYSLTQFGFTSWFVDKNSISFLQKSAITLLTMCILYIPVINLVMCLVWRAERRGTRLLLGPSFTGSFVQPSLSTSSCCSSCSSPVWSPCRRATPAVPEQTTSPGPSIPCYTTPTAHRPPERNTLGKMRHFLRTCWENIRHLLMLLNI